MLLNQGRRGGNLEDRKDVLTHSSVVRLDRRPKLGHLGELRLQRAGDRHDFVVQGAGDGEFGEGGVQSGGDDQKVAGVFEADQADMGVHHVAALVLGGAAEGLWEWVGWGGGREFWASEGRGKKQRKKHALFLSLTWAKNLLTMALCLGRVSASKKWPRVSSARSLRGG